nr:hypothetical protein [Tanacetum cinerariifolium]
MNAAMKHVALKFSKLEKFEGVDFRRWKKKMHFLLSSMSVVYVLTTFMPDDGGDNPNVEQNVETFNELWYTLEAKYMAEDASSKKFLVSNFTNYKMTDSRPVSKQYNELLGILGRIQAHLETFKGGINSVELGSHLRIEESLRAQDNNKPKGNNVVGPSVVNMVEHNNSFRLNIVFDNIGSTFMSTSKLNDSILWHAKLGHVHFKRMQDMSKDGLIPAFDMDTEKQKSRIDYFDTYAPVARICTIRLLIAMASIHNLIIHQMDVKTAFLNGELDEEKSSFSYMFDDMLIFGTDEAHVDLTKEFLSSRFSMKDMREADVILGIRIKHESNGITISQSHYIEKAISQLEYSRVISCLMYAMICTRPDIVFVVGKLSRLIYTGYPLVLVTLMQAGSATLKIIHQQAVGYSFLVVVIFLGLPRSKPVSLVKLIAPISIRYDSVATLAKAYSQMYNGKSRHLGVKHSMICELITNVVVSIEFDTQLPAEETWQLSSM